MNDHFRNLYAFNHGYCERLLADISDEEMLAQPSPDVNTPAWLLGHLTVCTDYALSIMGQEKRLPRTWAILFGPKTKPVSEKRPFPHKQELWEAYSAGHEAVTSASFDIAPELLEKPNSIEFLLEALPTSGDLLAHLMSTHEASHLGHLSNWRRQMGRPPLF